MKKAIIAVLALASFSAMAETKTMSCDISLVAALGEETTKVLSLDPKGAVVAANGDMFQIVVGDHIITSPKLKTVAPGIKRGQKEGVVFIERENTFQVTMDGQKWFVADNCKKIG